MPSKTAAERAKKRAARRPTTQREMVRTFRIPEVAWEKFEARARERFIAPSRVVAMFVEAYAAGDVELPMKRYDYANTSTTTTPTSEAGSAALEGLGEDYDPEMDL